MENKIPIKLIPRLIEEKDFPSFSEDIEDVSKTSWKHIKENHHFFLFFLVFATIGSLVSIIVYPDSLLIYVFLPIALSLWLILRASQRKLRAVFLRRIANQHGYSFDPIGLPSETSGSVYLSSIDNHRVTNVITGKYEDYDIKIFDFKGTIGFGKDRKVFEFSVSKIESKYYLPKIFLERKGILNSHRVSFKRKDMAKLSLEGDFNEYFSSYIVKGDQIAALQILAPDIMLKILENGKLFNIEFIGNNVFIYADWLIDDKANLNILHTLTKILIDELELVGKISK